MSEEQTARLVTAGMHCGSCAMLIDMTLEEVDGVIDVRTEYPSGVTEVRFDPAIVELEGIAARIRSLGYDVRVA